MVPPVGLQDFLVVLGERAGLVAFPEYPCAGSNKVVVEHALMERSLPPSPVDRFQRLPGWHKKGRDLFPVGLPCLHHNRVGLPALGHPGKTVALDLPAHAKVVLDSWPPLQPVVVQLSPLVVYLVKRLKVSCE